VVYSISRDSDEKALSESLCTADEILERRNRTTFADNDTSSGFLVPSKLFPWRRTSAVKMLAPARATSGASSLITTSPSQRRHWVSLSESELNWTQLDWTDWLTGWWQETGRINVTVRASSVCDVAAWTCSAWRHVIISTPGPRAVSNASTQQRNTSEEN